MRANPPPFKPFETKEERESKIRDFITAALDERANGIEDAIAVLAQSPESPVMKALLGLSEVLAERRIGAAIVLAGGATAAANETWSLSFCSRFAHEIRLTSNPRILDGHEQLVLADRSIWYGDCMRRDPSKRDAFAIFLADAPEAARQGRMTFARVWERAQSIYRNGALSSVVVTTAAEASACSVTAVVAREDAPALAHRPGPAQSLAETLAAWEPSTRH